MSDDILREVRPPKRAFLLGYALFFLILPLVVIWFMRRGTRLLIYADRLILRRGVISRRESIIYISDIRNVVIKQGPLERLVGVGAIAIASAGTGSLELEAPRIGNPAKVREVIVELMEKHRAKREND